MRDDWARILELERRQRKNGYELNALERSIRAAKEKLKLVDQSIPTVLNPCDSGGGTGSNVIRWAKDYCISVIFDTPPAINAAYSENPTLDALSLADAVDVLEAETFIPTEVVFEGGNYTVPYSPSSIYYQDGSKLWQHMATSGYYAVNEITSLASTHVKDTGWSFQCGWFPHASATIGSSLFDEGDEVFLPVNGKYVPGANRQRDFTLSDLSISTHAVPSWDIYLGALRSGTISSAEGLNYFGQFRDEETAPANVFTLITKWVSFWTYTAGGLRKSLKRLAYHHEPYNLDTVEDLTFADTIIEPYKYDDGPRSGTTGSYTLSAVGGGYDFTSPSANDFFDTYGTAELNVSWGTTCEDADTPITDETPEDWEDFCAAITAASATFLKIPGLTIKFNGTEITSASLGTYSPQPTISFHYASRLKDYLDANPDVSITYSFEAICGHVPAQPIYDAGEVTDGFSVIFPRNTNCDSRPIETENYLTIKMEASPPRYLFQDECCTPYASHCSVSSLTSNQIVWHLDPP